MRRIEKGLEPACMEELRQTPGADWSTVPGADKQKMRKQAWKEQYGLCAYCMSRLSRPSADGMKIEHFVPRAEDNTSLFDWSNLLGVCLGNLGVDGAADRFHCDTHRGNPEAQPEHRTLETKPFESHTNRTKHASEGHCHLTPCDGPAQESETCG